MEKFVFGFKALGSRRRLEILRFVSIEPREVFAIAKHLGVARSTASFHLKKLQREGYVLESRRGTYTFYLPTKGFTSSKLYKQLNAII